MKVYNVRNCDWVFRPSPDDLPVWKGVLPPEVNPYKYNEAINYIEDLLSENLE